MRLRQRLSSSASFILFFLVPCAVWALVFREFFTLPNMLGVDAASYWEHFRYYVEHMSEGVFPMWEFRHGIGIPFEFFARRIGAYNPFFWILILPVKFGVSFKVVYDIFLCGYMFAGCYGFLKILRLVVRETLPAYFGIWVFMFSSVALLTFNSYLMLVFTPLVWFFYFLVCFLRSPARFYLLGMTLFLMILWQTYIPFYSFIVIVVVAVIAVVFFFSYLRGAFSAVTGFVRKEKSFAAFCLGAALLSLVPGYTFYRASSAGNAAVVLSHRQDKNAYAGNALSVSRRAVDSGGIRPFVVLEDSFGRFESFGLDRYYLPIAFFFPFVIGLFLRASRRYLFFLSVALVMFLFALNDAVRGYDFFYRFCFIFRYFRNYEHFFYLAVLPSAVICSSLVLDRFLKADTSGRRKWLWAFWVAMAHGGGVWALWAWGKGWSLSMTALVVSGVFWISYFFLGNRMPRWVLAVFLMAFVIVPTLEPYSALRENNLRAKGFLYGMDDRPHQGFIGRGFVLEDNEDLSFLSKASSHEVGEYRNPNYISSFYEASLIQAVSRDVVDLMARKIFLFDAVRVVDDSHFSFHEFLDNFKQGRNIAFVSPSSKGRPDLPVDPGDAPVFQVLTKSRILADSFSYRTNSLSFGLRLEKRKFLVCGNAYDPKWRVFIDGEEVPLYRANWAFQGVVIPEGEHEVKFVYGRWQDYFFRYFFAGFFIFVMLWWLFLGARRYVR